MGRLATEMASIKQELASIKNEVDSISSEVGKSFVGISNDRCVKALNSVSDHCSYVRSRLDRIDIDYIDALDEQQRNQNAAGTNAASSK